MPDFLPVDGLADDIVAQLPPLKTNKAIDDAAKGLVDTVLEQVESLVSDAIEKALEKIENDAEEPSIADLITFNDVNGRDLGASLSEQDNVTRVAFFRGLLDGLDRIALDDLQAEIVRR